MKVGFKFEEYISALTNTIYYIEEKRYSELKDPCVKTSKKTQ